MSENKLQKPVEILVAVGVDMSALMDQPFIICGLDKEQVYKETRDWLSKNALYRHAEYQTLVIG